MTTARAYTPDMGEISGFGGTYEAGCQIMVLAGLEWFDKNPDATPKFHGFEGVFGLVMEDNDDAKALVRYMVDAANKAYPDGGVTGAMVHATVQHVFAAKKLGWDEYSKQMRNREEKE